jgi:protein TorT
MRNFQYILITGLAAASPAAASEWYPYKVDVANTPFDMSSPTTQKDYVPLKKASSPHQICVSFPHMKDPYWLAVDYGVVDEAKQLGVSLQVVEAGGYTELSKQISQIEDCASSGANAVVISAISFDGLNNVVGELKKKGIPVIDAINGIQSPEIAAKSLVSWKLMGRKLGEFMSAKHPAGSPEVKVAFFPGPPGAGWVEDVVTGFKDATKDSAIKILETKYGDTGKEVQAKLVEDMLQAHPDLNYIVGTAVTAEAAIPILRAADLTNQVKIVSTYYTPGVDQAIRRGQVMAALSDSPVIQGRVAVDQAVRVLEGKDYLKHVGPAIVVVTEESVKTTDMTSTLAPDDFKPTFVVK